MKILQINSVCGIGSTGKICTDIAEELVREGHECKIAYGRGKVPQKYKVYSKKIGSNFNVILHGIESRMFDRHGYGSRYATKKFIKWVKEYDPDIIHLHNIHGYYINIELLFDYLKDSGKKVVWTLHDCWAFTGHCAYFSYAECEKWKTECEKCSQLKEYPKCSFKGKVRGNFRKKKMNFCNVPNLTIVTPSNWLKELVKYSFLKEYHIEVINNGIDKSIFKMRKELFDEKSKMDYKKIILGVASTWDRRKGLEDFLKLNKIISQDYQIVLIGLSQTQIEKLPSDIIGIKKTNNIQELVSWYSKAYVFINTTYEDNYPTVNLEAQACGTPVITYRAGGSPESVPYSNIVEIGDVCAINEKLTDHLAINEKITSKKEMIKSYLQLYLL